MHYFLKSKTSKSHVVSGLYEIIHSSISSGPGSSILERMKQISQNQRQRSAINAIRNLFHSVVKFSLRSSELEHWILVGSKQYIQLKMVQFLQIIWSADYGIIFEIIKAMMQAREDSKTTKPQKWEQLKVDFSEIRMKQRTVNWMISIVL